MLLKRSCAAAALAVAVICMAAMTSGAEARQYPITVTNSCSDTMYIRGLSGSTELSPDNAALKQGASRQYLVDIPWSGRIYACWTDTSNINISDSVDLMKSCVLVEETIQDSNTSKGILSSNISFVDAISIPVRIQSPEGVACTNSGAVTAYFNPDDVLSGCPTVLVGPSGGPKRVCLSAFQYCSSYCSTNPSSKCNSFCSKLDSQIAACTAGQNGAYPGCAAAGLKTTDVYGCRTGTFFAGSQGEPYCMAINRGILSSYSNQNNPSKYYPGYPQDGPYNPYGAFVHHLTGNGIFAISYDDYPSGLNQGGYVNCQSSTSYKIELCPSKTQVINSYLGNTNDMHSAEAIAADTDVFAFSGTAGETVRIVINPLDSHSGKKAGLTLSGGKFSRHAQGGLSLELKQKLPHTGAYEIALTNMNILEDERYVGHFSVRLFSSGTGWNTLRPKFSVEKK